MGELIDLIESVQLYRYASNLINNISLSTLSTLSTLSRTSFVPARARKGPAVAWTAQGESNLAIQPAHTPYRLLSRTALPDFKNFKFLELARVRFQRGGEVMRHPDSTGHQIPVDSHARAHWEIIGGQPSGAVRVARRTRKQQVATLRRGPATSAILENNLPITVVATKDPRRLGNILGPSTRTIYRGLPLSHLVRRCDQFLGFRFPGSRA